MTINNLFQEQCNCMINKNISHFCHENSYCHYSKLKFFFKWFKLPWVARAVFSVNAETRIVPNKALCHFDSIQAATFQILQKSSEKSS